MRWPGAEVALLARPECLPVVRKSAKKQHIDISVLSVQVFHLLAQPRDPFPADDSKYFSLGEA